MKIQRFLYNNKPEMIILMHSCIYFTFERSARSIRVVLVALAASAPGDDLKRRRRGFRFDAFAEEAKHRLHADGGGRRRGTESLRRAAEIRPSATRRSD